MFDMSIRQSAINRVVKLKVIRQMDGRETERENWQHVVIVGRHTGPMKSQVFITCSSTAAMHPANSLCPQPIGVRRACIRLIGLCVV